MSPSATLTVTEHDQLHRTYVLDCPHATTTVEWLLPPVGGFVDERDILDMLRKRHRQSCACAWRIESAVTA